MILEEILLEIGDAGRFQFIFTTAVITMEVVVAWSMLQTAITGATPEWWCVDPSTYGLDNMTLDNTTFHTCPSSLPSLQPLGGSLNVTDAQAAVVTGGGGSGCVRYYDPAMTTIVSEWDLVCERKYIKAAINSVQMAGVMVGAVAAGQSSDSVGRRITCYVTMATHAVTCLAAGLSTSWQLYAAFRFIVGAAIGSYLVLHYVYVVEFVRHTWRPYLVSIPTWAMGAGLLCVTAWRVPHWPHLHYICAAISVPMMLGWFVSPESVRWLAAKGRTEAAEQVVTKIARINGRPVVSNISEQLALLTDEETSRGDSQHQYSYHLLFYGWKNALKTLVVSWAWMSLSMSFYGIIFGVSALSGNLFLNMFLLSVVEVPLTFATAFIVVYVGRRYTACAFFLLASMTGFAILLVDRTASAGNKGTIINVIAICSKMFIACAWTTMETYTVELYPTVIRSLGMGWANTAARVGGILAPFIMDMETADDAVRCYVIVGSVMAVSGLSVLLLHETKGKSLADTLHQDVKTLDL